MLSAFWRFTRPHTFIATAIQVVSLYFIAGGRQPLDSATLLRILATLATCLALNLCIVGLNQLTDVGIDRINKPRLPLASGDMSPATGKLLVILAGITTLLGGWSADGYLGTTVTVILVIGVLYSLPPFRFKRLPLPAALGIAVSRGVVANMGVALHFHHRMVARHTVSPRHGAAGLRVLLLFLPGHRRIQGHSRPARRPPSRHPHLQS
jgi:homogentisate phytyltransferase/homogentisate geranylgeranyltransferase